MLRNGRARRRSGVDVVVAYRERHGRAATAAQLADLDVLPTRTVTYRGASFAELDVTAVLDRRPELALVDELAHANLPGERHAKRWHDVRELLANGIDVSTTLNVANIETATCASFRWHCARLTCWPALPRSGTRRDEAPCC